MITTQMNQKQGLNRFSKLSDDGDPWAPNNLLKPGANEKHQCLTPVDQATDKKLRPYQLKWLALCRGHHRVWRPTHRRAIKEGRIAINHFFMMK